MINKDSMNIFSNVYGFIGEASTHFTYGDDVKINIHKNGKVNNSGTPNTRNLVNEDISNIRIGRYHYINELLLHVPLNLANEQRCGCDKCHPNLSGHKGQQFLIISVSDNMDASNLKIIARIDD